MNFCVCFFSGVSFAMSSSIVFFFCSNATLLDWSTYTKWKEKSMGYLTIYRFSFLFSSILMNQTSLNKINRDEVTFSLGSCILCSWMCVFFFCFSSLIFYAVHRFTRTALYVFRSVFLFSLFWKFLLELAQSKRLTMQYYFYVKTLV